MKKTFAKISMISALVLALTACGAKEEANELSTETAVVTETAVAEATVAEQPAEEVQPEAANVGNIISLNFTSNDDLELVVGKRDITTHLVVEVIDKDSFAPSDVEFVSTNPEVATITFEKAARNGNLYFAIDAISAGEVEVYAVSADGLVESTHKKVTVLGR